MTPPPNTHTLWYLAATNSERIIGHSSCPAGAVDQAADWLVRDLSAGYATRLDEWGSSPGPHGITLTNGIVERSFSLQGGGFCTVGARPRPASCKQTTLPRMCCAMKCQNLFTGI